jgi:hypothetical protein
LQQLNNECDESKLRHVLDRVKGMDLNPVAVLTARVNYFINVSHLIRDNEELEIPVYLGDSSYVPRKVIFDGIRCLEYSISTLKKAIEIIVPESMVSDSLAFSKSMTTMELHIKNLDSESAYNILISLVDKDDLTDKIIERLQLLSVELVELERNNWDGIWARIITNFLTTANIGRFDVIVGNPPWVDWKSLPSGYRDRIKSLCISRKLFSGDKLTGGINLNICALIANVAAENWLKEKGVLAFLMPEPLVYQPSYEGFRNLYMSNDSRLYFRKFTNWTKAGHPFKPVTQKFLTYYISSTVFNYADGVETEWFILKPGNSLESIEDISLDEVFDRHTSLLATCHTNKNLFSNIQNRNQLRNFKKIAGNSSYIGREGIEFYPQELMIFTLSGLPSTKTCTALANIQIKKSKYHVPKQNILL